MRILVLAFMAVLAAQPAAARTAKSEAGAVRNAPDPLADLRDQLQQGVKAVRDDNKARASALMEALIAAPGFDGLEEEERHTALYVAAVSAFQLNKVDLGLKRLKASSALSQADADEWSLRFAAGYATGDVEDSVQSLATLARRFPAALAKVDDQAVFYTLAQAGKLADGREKWSKAASALFAADWTPADRFADASSLWMDLARALLQRGDVGGATAAAARIVDPYAMVTMHEDPAFDPILKSAPARFDPARARDARIADLRAKSAADPDKLSGVNALAALLIQSGQAADALKILDAALARALPADASKRPYADLDKLVWTMDMRARALEDLGRWDEALIEITRASRRPENGNVNVSQTINRSGLLDGIGRPKEALEGVAAIKAGDVSPYGFMAAEETRAGAYMQLHDDAGLSRSLALAKTHGDDAPLLCLRIMLMAGDTDSAAALAIGQLKDPDKRGVILDLFQDWAPSPAAATAYDKDMAARFLALRERPDVKAALAAVGRVQSWPFRSPLW